MQVIWYIKKHVCRNGVEERTKYPVRSDYTTGSRGKREADRGARRADNAERQMARLLNNNFSSQTDRHIVLEYDDTELRRVQARADKLEGYSAEDALFVAGQQDLHNFIRRARRECGKRGIELRYLGATSDMDGETGEPARLHHHFVVNAEAAEICREKWRGCAWDGELYHVNGDLSALASYMVRQIRPVSGTQRYVPSRNLVPPVSEAPVPLVGNAAKYAENEMNLPKGCLLLFRSTYVRGAVQYIRYLRR